jgi:hypothetical protein
MGAAWHGHCSEVTTNHLPSRAPTHDMQIVMPAHLMDDNQHSSANAGRNLFADFSGVAERTGTYTAFDYADIMDHLVTRWRIPERQVRCL